MCSCLFDSSSRSSEWSAEQQCYTLKTKKFFAPKIGSLIVIKRQIFVPTGTEFKV